MSRLNNLSNPYGAFGLAHNDGVNYVIKNLNPKEEVTAKIVVDLISKYLQKVANTETMLDYIRYYELTSTLLNTGFPTGEWLREAKVPKEAICFINEIFNVSEEFDLSTTLKVLNNIERNILTSEMTKAEQQSPLLCVATAKASVRYWMHQVEEGKKSLWTPYVGDPAEFKWPWKKDAAGAVDGGITGLVGGIPGGVVGVLIGGLIGSLAGGIAASASAALLAE